LVVSYEGLDQSLSIVTGERTSKTASAYYRTTTSVDMNKQYGPRTAVNGDFSILHGVRFTEAEVTPYVEDLGWAKSGMVWLVLGHEDFALTKQGQNNGFYELPAFHPAKSVQVTDAAGRRYGLPRELSETSESFTGTFYDTFAVQIPETTRAVTFTYKPYVSFVADPGTTEMNPLSGTVTMPPLSINLNLPQ
jgi:hypothetical protein